ncbi:MAG: hypothetical protein V1882_09410, partial [Candidatus Omnitrophota bacterium]
LGASTVSGTLGVTANGAITDSGNLAVTGTATLAAGAANDITLDNNNNFSTVAITSGNNVVLKDTDALDLGASTVTGNLDVTTGTSLSDSGNVTAAGLKFNAGTTVTLDSANNDFDTVAGTSNGAIVLKDQDSLSVGTVNGTNGINSTNNDITLTSGGDLTLDKAVNAGAGDARLTATGYIREGAPTDDAAPVADVIGKNIYLTSNVASPSDALGLSSSYLDLQITNTATGSWNASVPNGGDIFVNCIGDCPLGQVDVGTGTFNFSTSGQLTDSNDTLFGEFNGATWNITAGGLNVKTGTGFGTATNAIETRLSDYGGVAGDGKAAIEGGTGGVFLANKAMTGFGLTIGGFAGGFIAGVNSKAGTMIFSGSPLTIASNIVDSLGGDITLAALGTTTADNLTVNNAVQVNATGGNGNILVVAGNDVSLKNNSRVTAAGSGAVKVVSGEDYTDAMLNQNGNANGDIVMNSSSAVRSQDGDILVDSARNIKISEVNADSNASGVKGDVTVYARTGRIEDNNGATLNITGDDLVLEAQKGIGVDGSNTKDAIEVAVKTLDAVNHNTRHLEVDQVAAGGNLDLLRADQQGSGDLDIRTLDGMLTVVAGLSGGSGVSAKNGAVTLSAQDAGGSGTDDLIVNNTVTSTTGKIHLDSTSRDAVFSADGDVTATGGAEIEVSAQRNVTMASGTVFDANGGGVQGGIDIDAVTGDVTLGKVITTSSLSTNLLSSSDAFDAVDINAGGAVIDAGVGPNITAKNGQTTLTAVTGIGSVGGIETKIKALKLTNTTSGDVRIRETNAGGDLDVIQATQSGPGALHILTRDGTLTVLGAALLTGTLGGVSATSGNLRLFAQDQSLVGTSHLVINNTVTSTTGTINLDSENDVRFSEKGDVTSASGDIAVDATDGIQMTDTGTDGTVLDAGTGRIDLDADGDILLTAVKTTSNGSDAVTIVSRNGALIDQGDTDVYNIETGAAGGMLISAKTGIGSTTLASPAANQGIETKGGQLAAETDSGDIQIFNTGALDITTLTDPTLTTSLGFSGVGTVTGVTIQDTAATDPAGFVFITSASPMTISSAVTNYAGGDISLYALGTIAGVDTMAVNNDVRTEGGNGNIRMVSGSSMTFDSLATGKAITVSTAGNGVVSGTGNVILGAGYDATGKAANEPAATLVGPGGAAGDTGANLTMTATSTVATEDGDILADAQNDFTVGLLHADGGSGKGDITDGVRGDVTTFSRNGSTLDADLATAVPQLNNIFAATWNGTAGKDIGLLRVNPIETNAPVQNLIAGTDIHIVNTGDALLNADSTDGSIQFESTGNILLGHAFAGHGQNSLMAGGSIFSQGGGSTRVIAKDVIRLIAGGVIGTASNHIQTQLNHAGNLFLEAHGQQGVLSANIRGNFTRASVQLLNTPPGLVSFNGIVFGGDDAPLFESAVSSLYYNPNPVSLPAYGYFDGRYAADFPAFFDQNRFAFAPVTSINTAGIDVLPIEGLGILPPVAPLPLPTPAPVPVPESERPPLTAPLPGLATPPAVQPPQEQVPGPVYVAPGRGSDAAAPSVLEPVSAQTPVQDSSANHNPPFPVSPISQSVRQQVQTMPSPIEQNEAANAGTGSAAVPAGVGSEARAR